MWNISHVIVAAFLERENPCFLIFSYVEFQRRNTISQAIFTKNKTKQANNNNNKRSRISQLGDAIPSWSKFEVEVVFCDNESEVTDQGKQKQPSLAALHGANFKIQFPSILEKAQ